MRKFVLKSAILFSVLLLLLFVVSDGVFRGEDAYGATIKSYKKQKEIDIAIFGSSHSLNAFDPRIFELELGSNTFNLSCTSQTISTTKAIAEMAIHDHDLKLAIIDVFWMTLLSSDSERGKALQMHSLDYVPASIAKSEVVLDLFEIDEIPYGFFETLRYHSKWHEKKPSNTVERYFIWNAIDSYKGYRNSNSIITQKDWNEFKEVYRKREASGKLPEQLTSYQKENIMAVINLFKSKDIPMLFVNSPSYLKDYYNLDVRYNTLIEDFLKELDIPYVNFHKLWDHLGLDKMYFKDPNHVNIRGAIQTSSYLASYIRDSLQLDFKKQDVNLLDNRYNYFKTNNFKKTIYATKMDSLQREGLFGITDVYLYRLGDGRRLEILFETETDSIKAQPVRLDFEISEEERKKMPEKLVVYDKKIASTFGEFKSEHIISYKGKNFIPYTFSYPFKTIKKMEFYAGNQRRVKVFSIENLKIED